MSSSFFKPFYGIIIFVVFMTLFISCFFGPYILIENSNTVFYPFNPNDEYVWPTPGYTYITSYFGKRSSPTARRKYIS